jgi:hypothetical protein
VAIARHVAIPADNNAIGMTSPLLDSVNLGCSGRRSTP